ncbi:MAG: sigma-70 family RNA polymerase sigma factor [Pirellulales bacterium]
MRSKLQRLAWVIVKDWSLAADAVQNSFLTLHQKWHQIPPENRIGWLVKTVQYSAHNLRRAQSASEPLHEALTSQPSDPNGRAVSDRLDLEEQMQWALSQLTELQREVVQLKLVEGLTFQEIADRLHIPLGTALSRMRLALERLRTTLKDSPNE